MLERMIAVEHGLADTKTDVLNLERHVYGNGKEGLIMKVARLEQKVGHIEQQEEAQVLNRKDRMAIWFGPLAAVIVGWLLSLLK